MNRKELAAMMDHTLLKATATTEDIEKLCQEAIDIGAASVCVNPVNVKRASKCLKDSPVKVCTVIGFPLGANTSHVKAYETRDAIKNGADEVDMVINIGALLDGKINNVEKDIHEVVQAAKGKTVKVIIETCYLNDAQIIQACEAAARAGADFVKTSTGFGTGGAKAADVLLMRKSIPDSMKVKASGGMRSLDDVLPMIDAGADRLGVSASLDILAGLDEEE